MCLKQIQNSGLPLSVAMTSTAIYDYNHPASTRFRMALSQDRAAQFRLAPTPSNIEVKARLRRPERTRELAECLCGSSPEEVDQLDTFFGCQQGRLKLREVSSTSGELIFYRRDDVPGPKQSEYLIVHTSSPSVLRGVLAAALGTKQVVEKSRTLFLFGQTRIHLDAVENLEAFVGLELVLWEDQSAEEGPSIVRHLMRFLEIGEGDLVEGAYADLLPATSRPPIHTNEKRLSEPYLPSLIQFCRR